MAVSPSTIRSAIFPMCSMSPPSMTKHGEGGFRVLGKVFSKRGMQGDA